MKGKEATNLNRKLYRLSYNIYLDSIHVQLENIDWN